MSPRAALHQCLYPGCPRLLEAGERCPEHSPSGWTRRERPAFRERYPGTWETTRARVLQRDGFACQICARRGVLSYAITVDHVIALGHGGSHHESNLQSVCDRCHVAKSAAERRRG
jgi:5-methylcytosine-specific restriction protein A